MRLILIPGFGEDETIFSKITPMLPHDKIVLNTWKLVSDEPEQLIDALIVAKEITQKYEVSKDDIVIGHSLGGRIALFIKHLTNCRIIQVASWTDFGKIIWPVKDYRLIYTAVKNGLVFNSFTKQLLLTLDYKGKPSESIFCYIMDMIIGADKNNINNQLRVICREVNLPVLVEPDLRIHAVKDTIVKPPEEQFYEVPGDHFSLYTYPVNVISPILSLIESNPAGAV